MDLIVTLLGGETRPLRVEQHATVRDLKKRISEVFNLSVDRIKLTCDNGQKIQLSDDSKVLSFYGLHSGSKVWLLVTPEPAPFQVFLKNEKGQTSVYDVSPGETVTRFKAKVYNKEGVPVDQQRLIHNGKQFDDGRTLADYDVAVNSTIYLTLRLRGG